METTTSLLKASIKYENVKRSVESKDQYIVRLEAELQEQKKANKFLCDHSFKTDCFLSTALDEFEARFDNEKTCDSLEIAIWYCAAAKHMGEWGRVIHNVEGVQEWIDQYVHPSTRILKG